MPYSSFSLKQVKTEFNLVFYETTSLFPNISPAMPSNLIQMLLKDNVPLATAINSEKARAEMIINPVLVEIKRQMKYQIGLFSGNEFTVDPNKGLAGNPDFLITRNPEQYFITAPVLTIVEAKNENINSGLGQCCAEMIAAQLFNAKEGNPNWIIYGCVTTGLLWKFLKLEETNLFIDPQEVTLFPLDVLLGIFLQVLNC